MRADVAVRRDRTKQQGGIRMLKRALFGLVVLGAFLLWHFGRNATMPSLAEEAQMAPPAQATSVTFKKDSWACTAEEFKHQVLQDKSYYASPVVIKIVGGAPQFCREINTSHGYTLVKSDAAPGPCPDHSCVAFRAEVRFKGRTYPWVLYAPNSFIASSN
ncbi:hypothetical protein HF690_09535 [Oleiagrimonas citrea]|uniref:Uncharacterized protein n=1 Tax=Oleiagrimonas citrea TaxID=1665687 RepID=A0A846ZNQ3_9GAMM|nr:hypothetical protein [Oleiagrimonas citrea]NKZ39190.1 hypothetical protein [Oleiagrimonas citrea]